MTEKIRGLPKGKFSVVGLAAIFMVFIAMGCSCPPPQGFDAGISGPQMIVEPSSISLGVATLTKTPIIFRGKGFDPGDSVFIKLLGVKKGDKSIDLPVADANIGKDGGFTAKVSTLVKVSEILRAQLGSNKKMETIIIVNQPPMPPGTYTARAVSMESDKTADCVLIVNEPSFMDSFKDWIGGMMGKIVKK